MKMSEARRNVELKARDVDPESTLAACRAFGARDNGVLRQRDTYFRLRAGAGRLKLREESPGTAHLIYYERASRPEERESAYRIVELEDGDAMRTILSAALGVACVVQKERRLLRWENVRIHLDRVDRLGTFVEFEAVAPTSSDLEPEYARIAKLRDALAIDSGRLVACGYAELLQAQQPQQQP